MEKECRDNSGKPIIYAVILLLFCGALAMHIFGWRTIKRSPESAGIVVVSGGRNRPNPGAAPRVATATSVLPAPELSTPHVRQAIATSLPSLREVHVECEAGNCTVIALPGQTAPDAAQQELERLLTHDIPLALSQSAFELLEPVQIEEVGSEQYRLKFRIGGKPRL